MRIVITATSKSWRTTPSRGELFEIARRLQRGEHAHDDQVTANQVRT
jgi:hypothetical protein